jgi:hypothetical protein
MPKWRVWWWNVTLGLAAIAIGAFVLFEVVDLDGSQLRAQAAEGALTETCSADTLRLCIPQPTPHALSLSPLPSSPSTATDAPRLRALVLRTHAPRSATLARARLTLASANGSGSATDPA